MARPDTTTPTVGTALFVSFVRLPLLALGALGTLGLLALAGKPVAFPPAPDLASRYFIIVNAVCLALLRAIVRREGRRLRDLLGFDPARLPRDVAWGLLWVAVPYLPFVAAVIGTMALLYGGDLFTSFERVFAPRRRAPPPSRAASPWRWPSPPRSSSRSLTPRPRSCTTAATPSPR